MTQLFGLIICGGRSSRMGEDKSLIKYFGLPHRYYLYELLRPLCGKVFLSCNHEQVNAIPEKYNMIADAPQYAGIGPMAALLSAFELHNNASFLIIGCDYPLIKKEDVQKLIDARNENSITVSYFNKAASINEPLLAVYENKSFDLMKKKFEEKKYSLRYFLEELNTAKVLPSTPETLISVNTKEQYLEISRQLSARNN